MILTISILILKNIIMENWLFLTEKEILEEIGKRLKKIRVQHNLTQQALCEEVGLSVTTISQIEQGKSTTVESLIRILMRLNRIKDLESVFRVAENLELKLKFEKAKLKSDRTRASKKIK
jgi:transcriptional regulator with XRE-family HTH domain